MKLVGDEICDLAAKYGHLEMLDYAHKNKCKWSEKTCKIAA